MGLLPNSCSLFGAKLYNCNHAIEGWLCPNIYFLGNCGVVDLVDKTGEVALTIGGLSGIFKGHDYLKGRFERTPYDKSSMRSVYHVRNIDEFRLKSMPPGNYSDYTVLSRSAHWTPNFTNPDKSFKLISKYTQKCQYNPFY